jgi:L-rhamnose mutarotase
MQRVEFKMNLNPGCAAEYKARHEKLWPELLGLLKDAGIEHYSISLDEETNVLYAGLSVNDPHCLDKFGESEVMRRWWVYMSDIMESNPDKSPVIKVLTPLFFLL